MPQLVEFTQQHVPAAVHVWNVACGARLAITAAGFRYNMLPSTGARQAGRIALMEGRLAGFVLAADFAGGDPAVSQRETGWIEAIAVDPLHQHRGVGTALMDWAEGWLEDAGCQRFRLGASLRPFAPGLPSELPADFFRQRGYINRPTGSREWDVARDLRDYDSPASVRAPQSHMIRAAAPGDEAALNEFFDRCFPGRWAYEHREFIRGGGRISDFTILQTNDRIEGFCWLDFEDSFRPLDRFFMETLPKPWGHLGPIGVSAVIRGGGWGGAVLDAGLRRLRDAGVAGCVIDWTDLLDFYGKVGFKPYRSYEMLVKAAA